MMSDNKQLYGPRGFDMARQLRAEGLISEAYSELRRVQCPSKLAFSALSNAAYLYERMLAKTPPDNNLFKRRCRLAWISSTTSEFILPVLRLLAWRDFILLDCYAPPFDSVDREIYDDQSGLYKFKPDIVILADNWRDSRIPAISSGVGESVVAGKLQQILQRWKLLEERIGCRVIQHSFDFPPNDAYGNLAGMLSGGRMGVLRAINASLPKIAIPNVTVLQIDEIVARVGAERWHDSVAWFSTRQHPGLKAIPDLLEADLALIRATLGLTKKVLVVDLDNTLWGGVVGESGVGGLRLGAPDPVGEAYSELQRYLLELKERGVLLAVCSKNNEVDARAPFENHNGMTLKLEDLVGFMVNWEPKSSNIRSLAEQLNLGIDSFVFLDDQGYEREEVRAELPGVAVPEPDSEHPTDLLKAIHDGRWFETLAFTDEDRRRHESYKANAERSVLQKNSGSLAEFLKTLGLRVDSAEFDESTLSRVAQLVGKTNQFNLTSRRHDLPRLLQIVGTERSWTQWYRVRDRFGDYGIVGVLIATVADNYAKSWEIDTWLISCRALGRGVEDVMFSSLLKAAKRCGITRLIGIYKPSEKNVQVADFYPRLGFSVVADQDNGTYYQLDLGDR